jgi:hypothetical protein
MSIISNLAAPNLPDPDALTISDVVIRIERLTAGLVKFWRNPVGWAPPSATGLLSKSRLDWQASLAKSLGNWLREPPAALSDGDLILAWTNVGTLVEGALKLLLSVYYENYKADIEALKSANAFNYKKGTDKPPDGLGLESLRLFVKSHALLGKDGDELVALVQQRRNAIHAFEDRPIGDEAEFHQALRGYLRLLRSINNRLPYPGEPFHAPNEL